MFVVQNILKHVLEKKEQSCTLKKWILSNKWFFLTLNFFLLKIIWNICSMICSFVHVYEFIYSQSKIITKITWKKKLQKIALNISGKLHVRASQGGPQSAPPGMEPIYPPLANLHVLEACSSTTHYVNIKFFLLFISFIYLFFDTIQHVFLSNSR